MESLKAGAIVLLCLCSAACDERKPAAQAEMPPPLVGVMEVEAVDVPLYATFMGQTQGSRSAAVRPQVTGILQERLYEEGAQVAEGEALFAIDPAPFKAALEQAQGQLASAESTMRNARREYDRVQRLYRANAVSQQQRDSALTAWRTAQAQAESARAAVDEARIRLGYCRVSAPIAGRSSREVSTVGSLVTPQDTLTYIDQSDPMDVHFSVPAEELFAMRDMEAAGRAVSYGQGSPVDLHLLEGTEYGRAGKVVFLDTQVDVPTSSVRAKARFPNPDGMLLPGQFVTVRVGGARLVKAIMLPQEALMQTESGPQVYVLDKEDRARLVPVTVGPAFGEHFLVEKGLEAGQRLVVLGQDKVRAGQKVKASPVVQGIVPLDTPQSSPTPPAGGGVEAAPAPVEAAHE